MFENNVNNGTLFATILSETLSEINRMFDKNIEAAKESITSKYQLMCMEQSQKIRNEFREELQKCFKEVNEKVSSIEKDVIAFKKAMVIFGSVAGFAITFLNFLLNFADKFLFRLVTR